MKIKLITLLLLLVFARANFSASANSEPNVNTQGTIQLDSPDTMINLLTYIRKNLFVIYEILQQNRVLAVKAANGTYTWKQRKDFNLAFEEMFKEVARTIKRAKYKKYPLLEFTNPQWVPLVVMQLDEQDVPVVYALPKINVENYGYISWSSTQKAGWPKITTPGRANQTLGYIDVAMAELESELILVGAVIQRLTIAKKVDRKDE